MALTLEQETAIDEKLSGMNKAEMQTRYDELEAKDTELTEEEEYEMEELDSHLDMLREPDEDDEDEDEDNDEFKAEKEG